MCINRLHVQILHPATVCLTAPKEYCKFLKAALPKIQTSLYKTQGWTPKMALLRLLWGCHQGPNFIVLLNGKQIFVLTVAEKKSLRCKRISLVSRKIRAALFRIHHGFVLWRHLFSVVSTGRLARLFVCLRLAALWNGNCAVSITSATKQLYQIRSWWVVWTPRYLCGKCLRLISFLFFSL